MLSNLLKGSIWALLLQWSNRVIGLISTIILARILSPDDYGIVAVAMIVVFFSSHLTSAGTGTYLIKLKNIELKDIQTGFSFLLITRIFTTATLLYFSVELAVFFGDDRLVHVFKFIAFIPLIETFRNMSILLEERKLSYNKIFIIGFHRKVFSFLVAIGLATNGFGYMSLIYAEFFGAFYYILVSHFVLPTNMEHYKLGFSRFYKQAGFTFWSFLQILVGFIKGKIDSIFVAKILGVDDLGVYQLSHSISSIPTEQLATPVSAPIYAAISKFDSGSKAQFDVFFASLTTVSMLVYFLAGLLSSVANEVVIILLGEKWLSVIPLISFLSFSYAIGSCNVITSRLLISHNRVKELFINDIFAIVIVVALLASALINGGLYELVVIRVYIFICLTGLMMVFASVYCNLNIIESFKCIFPSAIISFASYFLISNVLIPADLNMLLTMVIKGIGYVSLVGLFIIIWSILSGFKNRECIYLIKVIRKLLSYRKSNIST